MAEIIVQSVIIMVAILIGYGLGNSNRNDDR